MREIRTSGSVGGPVGQPAGSTRFLEATSICQFGTLTTGSAPVANLVRDITGASLRRRTFQARSPRRNQGLACHRRPSPFFSSAKQVPVSFCRPNRCLCIFGSYLHLPGLVPRRRAARALTTS